MCLPDERGDVENEENGYGLYYRIGVYTPGGLLELPTFGAHIVLKAVLTFDREMYHGHEVARDSSTRS